MDQDAPMTVGVVIPCRNEASTIGRLLDALAGQDQLPNDVVVVDDGSSDGTSREVSAWCARHGGLNVRLLPGPRRGVAAAVNTGIRTLETEIVIRLDGHSEPARNYVGQLSAIAASPNVGVSGGAWVIAPAVPTCIAGAIAVAAGHPFGSGGAAYRHPSKTAALDTDTVPFGCFRRQVWEALGGYDESLVSNEDYEFNWRVRRRGLRVVLDPSVHCTYIARATFGALARQYFGYGQGKAKMLWRHPTSLRLRQMIPAAVTPVLVGSFLLGVLRAEGRWLTPAVGYAVALALAGLHAGARSVRLLPDARELGGGLIKKAGLISTAFAVMHVSWSSGFWVSLVQSLKPASRPESPAAVDTDV